MQCKQKRLSNEFGVISMAGIAGIGMFYLVCIILCFTSPLLVRFLLFAANLAIPDPLPFVDEMLMGLGVISKIKDIVKAIGILRFIGNIITVGLLLLAIAGVVYVIAH